MNEPSRDLMCCDRKTVSLVVQFLTGHNFLRYHELCVGRVESGLCCLCGEDRETSAHLMWVCLSLARCSMDYWMPVGGDLPSFDVLIKFLKHEVLDLLLRTKQLMWWPVYTLVFPLLYFKL